MTDASDGTSHTASAPARAPEPGADPAASDTTAHLGTPLTPGQYRALKIAVVAMSVFIVLALIAIVARVATLVMREPDATTTPTTAGATTAPLATLPAEAVLALPTRAAIVGLSLDGNRLAVHYRTPAGDGIALYDTVAGRVVSRISVRPGP